LGVGLGGMLGHSVDPSVYHGLFSIEECLRRVLFGWMQAMDANDGCYREEHTGSEEKTGGGDISSSRLRGTEGVRHQEFGGISLHAVGRPARRDVKVDVWIGLGPEMAT
jgi:hypothetical protein